MTATRPHNCERCNALRQVPQSRLDQGKARFCRKCNGRETAMKVKSNKTTRGKDRAKTSYWDCAQCGKSFLMTMIEDRYCSKVCIEKRKKVRAPLQKTFTEILKAKKL